MELQQLTVVRHTANFERMIAFYRDALGMTITEHWDRSSSDRGALLAPAGDVRNAVIEVLTLGELAVAGVSPANVVLTLLVENAKTAMQQLEISGVPIARGLEDTPWGHRSFGVDDPDGLRIWIVEDLHAE